jgi:EAL domain-containing protein (putative c-di-GMP-specific phosphodiesterase class I)
MGVKYGQGYLFQHPRPMIEPAREAAPRLKRAAEGGG